MTAILCMVFSFALAQPVVPGTNTGDAYFKAVKDKSQETTAPKLGNAEPADPLQWQASFYSWAGAFRCTSSLIGPQVLLTAAHCVGDGKRVSLEIDQTVYSGSCAHHPTYAVDPSADYALCQLDLVVPGIPYERINTKADELTKGRRLRLSGYGCTSLTGTGQSDQIYRIGEAPITALPGEVAGEPNSIITASQSFEDALLCRGDSGGPAFIESELSSARKIVSVNSRVWAAQRRSYLSSLTTPKAMKWLVAWSQTSEMRRICGLLPEPTGCR